MSGRRKLQVEVVALKGDSYEMGVKQGTGLKRGKHMHIHADGDVAEAKSLLVENSPNFLKEIEGLAEGMGIDVNTAIQWYGGYDIKTPAMGCSTMTNDYFYVRNYDFSDELYDARLVLLNPDNGYASIGFSHQGTGRLDGMNEKGLVIGLHLVNEKVGQKGFLATAICRFVLEQCAGAAEAVSLIKQIPHQFCFNFSIMDREGNHAVVEASPEEQLVYYSSQLVCTNHFASERLKNNNRAFIDVSLRRKNYLETLEKENLTPISAYHIFNNEDSPLFFKHYKEYFGTLHTVVYCPKDLGVVFGIGGNCAPYALSFGEWLAGEAVLPQTFEGMIEV